MRNASQQSTEDQSLVERLLPAVLTPFIAMHLVQVVLILASEELAPLGLWRSVVGAILGVGFAAAVLVHRLGGAHTLGIGWVAVATTIVFMFVLFPQLSVQAWRAHGTWLGTVSADCMIPIGMLAASRRELAAVTGLLLACYVSAAALIDGLDTLSETSFLLTSSNMVGIGAVCFGIATMVRAESQRRVEAERALAVSQERNRLHRMIHDAALQPLDAIAGGWDVDLDALRITARQQSDMLRAAIRGDDSMDELLMSDRIRSLAEGWSAQGLAVALDLQADDALVTPPRARALVGAVGEALNNVAKHAQVKQARVSSQVHSSRLFVEVADSGQGFDASMSRSGLGLVHSIGSRLCEVQGGSEVESQPGRGTTILMWVPLESS